MDGGGAEVGTFRNPVIAGGPGTDHGDPFAIKYLDAFYLYHSGETAGRRGISVYRSTNLVDWEFQGFALEAAARSSSPQTATARSSRT